ncbi:MAG: transglutaminase domain-containing protein [Bryobacteraceae bacterium]
MIRSSFDRAERSVLGRLKTPARIAQFLDREIAYNHQSTCRSPRRLLRDRKGHCMEGALFAAAALRELGYPPLLISLESEHDDDHVLAVFRENGHWGSIAKSNYSGLRHREPVFRTLRELVMSYFEHYFNLRREKTLRAYSRPVNLQRFDAMDWMTSEDDVWAVPRYLCEIAHIPLLTGKQLKGLTRVDERLFNAGLAGRI